MIQRVLSFVLLGGLSWSVHAVNLAPFPPPKDDALPINDNNPPPIPCDKIVARLTALKQMQVQHEGSLTFFLGQVGQKVTDWHTQLAPLEGTTQTIPKGQFDVLLDGGNKISQITDAAYGNSSLLSDELDLIINSLNACTIK
jgi:hypothetical protein